MRVFFVTNILSMGGAAAAAANRGTLRLGYGCSIRSKPLRPDQGLREVFHMGLGEMHLCIQQDLFNFFLRFDINQKVSKGVYANMLVQVVQSHCFMTKPTERCSSRSQVECFSSFFRKLFGPPMLLPHVIDHIELVQVAHTLTLWADHLAFILVDHPEHLVLHCRVLLGVALEVSNGTGLSTDLADPWL